MTLQQIQVDLINNDSGIIGIRRDWHHTTELSATAISAGCVEPKTAKRNDEANTLETQATSANDYDSPLDNRVNVAPTPDVGVAVISRHRASSDSEYFSSV